MNVKRFHARTAREALAQARAAFGDDAVVLSTKPCAEGVEVLALAPESVPTDGAPTATAALSRTAAVAAAPEAASVDAADPGIDDELPSMSTLSFRDYVRERMHRRRQAAEADALATPVLATDSDAAPDRALRSLAAAVPASAAAAAATAPAAAPVALHTAPQQPQQQPQQHQNAERVADAAPLAAPLSPRAAPEQIVLATARADVAPARPPVLRDVLRSEATAPADALDAHASRRDQMDMMAELRAMKGLIEDRFGALAFMDRMQRQPAQARLTHKLLDAGFSPALTRSLLEHMDATVTDELGWASRVLERNVLTGEAEAPLEDQGGVYALVGATGVGKTTSTAKIAAAFAAKHGAANLGLITLDAYRVGAHEQLRAYGRILGVPVHTAHDRVTLEDLLDLLGAKKMVLIDTAGMGQRDARTRELLDTLGHRSIQRLLVVNAAAQGETIEDVMLAYGAPQCAGVVISKMDEAVKLGPAIDAVIRHKMKVVGIANGQRVPEDWHRMSAAALVHRALRTTASSPYRMDPNDASLLCASAARMPVASALSMAA